MPGKQSDDLDPQRMRFVEAYMRTSDATASAIEAGYARGSARTRGWKLLQQAAVLAEIDRRKAEIRQQTGRDIADAIREADETIKFCKDNNSPMALTKAVEHKHKLEGFLKDKTPGNAQGFVIQISGVEFGQQDSAPKLVEATIVDG
jgi:hypothetical protein